MADQEQLEILKQGVTVWNEWRKAYPTVRCDLIGTRLRGADLNGINLSTVNLRAAVLCETNFRNADLSGAYLIEANLIKADLTLANLRGTDLTGAKINRADVSNADLSEAHFRWADCGEANLLWANMRGAHFSGAKLNGADLSGASLRGADLSGADLRRANFLGTNLRGADLTGANLRGANLRRANLGEADLRGANLSEANFNEANLREANLSETVLFETNFTNLDLSACIGLESCVFRGPCVIDTRTLQQSGLLPLVFLRGVGFPDRLIDYLPSLMSQPVQHYSCFISYSNKNEDFARRLHADLQARGVRCWFAPEDMKIGARILDTIDEAIRLRDKVLLVLSEASVASEWVEDEVTKAFAEERRRGTAVLFPVRIDDAVFETGEAWATKLRDNRNIGDFRVWKEHGTYQKALERVLRDLKTEPPEVWVSS